MDLNAVILAGTLAEDPAPGARKHDVCTFTLAFQGPFAADRGAAARSRDFVPVVAFGRAAEACLRHLKKGSRVVVDGRLRDDRWRRSGAGGSAGITVVCDRIHFVSGLKRDAGSAPSSGASASVSAAPVATRAPLASPARSL